MALGLALDEKHHDKWTKTGCIMDDGDINNWSVTYEGSHMSLFECGHQFSSIDMDSINTYNKMTEEGLELARTTPFAFNWSFFPADMMGPSCLNYQNWLRKVKKTFDPNAVSDPTQYVSADLPPPPPPH
jgi:hypothetical protein